MSNKARSAWRTTRDGDIAVRVTEADGSVIDISTVRVKAYVPARSGYAPAGALHKVRFDDALPGSKGYKRLPTPEELALLRSRP